MTVYGDTVTRDDAAAVAVWTTTFCCCIWDSHKEINTSLAVDAARTSVVWATNDQGP